jgi:uncharacterized phage-associated protein
MNALDIAYRLIKLARANRELVPDLSQLKLQKILFYAAGWYAAQRKERLFVEDLYAWKYGPVVPVVYEEFKRFESRDLLEEKTQLSTDDVAPNTELDDDLMSVLRKYGKMSAYELVARTHDEWVWRKNYNGSNELMPFEEIKEAFLQKLPASVNS